MRRYRLWSGGVCGVLVAVSMAAGARAEEPVVDLLTTQDASGQLAGWESFSEKEGTKTGDVWTLRDGVLTCQGTPRGYVYTSSDYQDFVLTLQWRWLPDKKPGNGGVLIRMTGPHKIWPKSLEAQLNAGQAGDFWGLGGYALQGPPERSKSVDGGPLGQLTNVQKKSDAEKPAGEWNQYEVIARGGTVTLKVNGQVVNQATGCDIVPGKICLTAEGDAIEFRHVRLRGKSS